MGIDAIPESMMFRGELPWHGLGVRVTGIPTWQEAIAAAGLDWTVKTQPLALRVRDDNAMVPMQYQTGDHPIQAYPTVCPACGGSVQDSGDLRQRRCAKMTEQGGEGCGWTQTVTDFVLGDDVPEARAVVRSTDNRVLGVVGPDWTPLQNVDAFRWFDPFVEKGLASYWTAGSLHRGEVVWVLAKLEQGASIVENDSVAKFILLSNAHRGGTSARVGFCPIVVVCANTLQMAHEHAGSKLIRVRHTESVKENLEALRDIMNVANQEFEATAEQYRILALTDIVEADLKRFVRTTFFSEAVAGEEKVGTRILDAVLKLYEEGRGASERGHNLWRAYQAVTEFLTWGRGRTPDSRLTSAWFGDSAKLNLRALKLALDLAKQGVQRSPAATIETVDVPDEPVGVAIDPAAMQGEDGDLDDAE